MSSGVYSCLKCRKQVKSFEELSSSQHLCKACRSKYPPLTCKFCRADFHHVSRAPLGDMDPVCTKCSEYLDRFGKPRVCTYCNLLAAFKGDLCHRCQASQKKYGASVVCQQCRVKCAFHKSDESRQKVGDQVLCFVCTIAYKKAQHRSVKRKSESQAKGRESLNMPIVTTVEVSSGTTTITASAVASAATMPMDSPPYGNTLVPPPKKRKFANGSTLSSPVTTGPPTAMFGGIASSGQPSSAGTTPSRLADSSSRAPLAFSHLADDPMSSFEMVNTLTEKVAALQKQVKDRDLQLMEKDKKATEFKAEVRDTEKSLRLKIVSLNKQLENSQAEAISLRRQIAQLNKTTKSKSKEVTGRALARQERQDSLFGGNVVVKKDPEPVAALKESAGSHTEQTEKTASPLSALDRLKSEDNALSSSDID